MTPRIQTLLPPLETLGTGRENTPRTIGCISNDQPATLGARVLGNFLKGVFLLLAWFLSHGYRFITEIINKRLLVIQSEDDKVEFLCSITTKRFISMANEAVRRKFSKRRGSNYFCPPQQQLNWKRKPKGKNGR